MTDERLRERFQALREAEAELAPSFGRTLARAEETQASPRLRWLWVPAAAASIALIWLLFALPPVPARPAPLDPGSWAMPTDVLLEMPGAALLHELPAIGSGIENPSPRMRTSWIHRRILG